jgi:cytochrome c oxidase cbb3-type subunit III
MNNALTYARSGAAAALALILLSGCDRMRGDERREMPPDGPPRGVIFPPDAPLDPGPQPASRFIESRNPFEGDRQALRDGERYYVWYNCNGCHGILGGGGIGPPLRAEQFIYGNDAASIYQSIAQGRPQGMPAFGGITSEDMIWKMVAYIQALSRGEDVGPQPMQPTGSEAGADIQAVGAPPR